MARISSNPVGLFGWCCCSGCWVARRAQGLRAETSIRFPSASSWREQPWANDWACSLKQLYMSIGLLLRIKPSSPFRTSMAWQVGDLFQPQHSTTSWADKESVVSSLLLCYFYNFKIFKSLKLSWNRAHNSTVEHFIQIWWTLPCAVHTWRLTLSIFSVRFTRFPQLSRSGISALK